MQSSLGVPWYLLLQQELQHIWKPSHQSCLLHCSCAPQWLYEIFISVLIVVFHSLSSEVNAVMLDYSINYAAVLLLFTEGTSTLEHFCLDPHRVCFELLIVFMSLTSSHSFPRTGPLAWLGMETARHWLDSQHTKLQPSAVFLWHLSKHSLTQRHCVCRCPSPFFLSERTLFRICNICRPIHQAQRFT